MDWYLGVLKQYAVFDGRARRKEYWMLLIALIPFVGWLVVLYFLVQPGETAANNYGPDPKAEPGPDQRATSNLPVTPK
jgi:uncharacterized membrane protein YhaH (DUF805 family)